MHSWSHPLSHPCQSHEWSQLGSSPHSQSSTPCSCRRFEDPRASASGCQPSRRNWHASGMRHKSAKARGAPRRWAHAIRVWAPPRRTRLPVEVQGREVQTSGSLSMNSMNTHRNSYGHFWRQMWNGRTAGTDMSAVHFCDIANSHYDVTPCVTKCSYRVSGSRL
jgi:hypothetical protein